ncbi:hypothetical protein RvY_19018 [Ramazzottius varieornatus]|uniref:Uncharacterized protein n=1 Tax=Ramazzottius varieornatus TaxID=947166 RepID=A0A1D1WBZ6_RAMVA|nr:hypothetical protein RvY_19018 [Ramazzottius varieornatus]
MLHQKFYKLPHQRLEGDYTVHILRFKKCNMTFRQYYYGVGNQLNRAGWGGGSNSSCGFGTGGRKSPLNEQSGQR